MGRAPALLTSAAAVAALALYDTFHASLWNGSTWWDVAFIALVLMPVSFAVDIGFLPLLGTRDVFLGAAALLALTVVFNLADWQIPENLAKLCGVTLAGYWFLGFFEAASWVVLVALIIPWVDAFSVFSHRGPTHKIVAHHPYVLNALSYAFPIPGEHNAANLGVPDILFFALFLAAAAQFRLRVAWTWIALVASLGATIALAVDLNLAGLPALPGLALGFLVPNADRLWALRHSDAEPQRR